MNTLLGDPAVSFSSRLSHELGELSFLGLIFLAVFPAFMLDTVRFSNRFVGPIVRLRRHLVELGQNGETDEVKFRGNDFWQSVASEFNEINEQFKAQKAEIAELKQQLSQQTTVNA